MLGALTPSDPSGEHATLGDRGRPATLFRWARSVRDELAKEAFDVVHVHLSTPAFVGAALVATGAKPSVWTFHLLPPARWPLDFMARLPSAWALRVAARDARRHFVAVSHADRALLATKLRHARLTCVVNAPPPLEDSNEDGVGVERPGEIVVAFVGRLERQKGLDRLLSAMASAGPSASRATLLVAGDGAERNACEAQCARLGLEGRVRFLGERAPRAVFQAADLVVCPSRFEGTPLVPMEAVRCGAPVVVSRIAPHEALFASVPGSLLPANVEEWPGALGSWMEDATRRDRLRAAQSALAPLFSFDRVCDEYRAVYAALVAGP
jgi:glycosyltransferase involved in cell wall biosynthesis